MEEKTLAPLAIIIKEENLDESEHGEEMKNSLETKDYLESNTSYFQQETMGLDYKKMKLSRASRRLIKTREVDEVRKKFQENKYALAPKEGARSEVWKKFHIIVDSVTGEKTEFVQCIFCNFIRKYTGTTTGTSQLLRHCCENSKEGPYAIATKHSIQTMLKSCLEFCATDMYPLEIIEGPGFEKLAQCLIELGAKCGRLKIEEIMPSSSTLAKQISQDTDTAMQELFVTIMPYIEKEHGAISLSTWIDDFKEYSYTNVTFHYIDENWSLNSCLLFTEYAQNKKNFSDSIRKKITRKLLNLGVTQKLIQAIPFVSDHQTGGPLENRQLYRQIPCAESLFNMAIEKILSVEYLEAETPKIHHTLTGLHSFATFLNQKGLSTRLPHPDIYENDQSWRIKLSLLKSIVEQSKEIFDLMHEKQHDWFTNFNVVVAQELLEFLKLFEEAVNDLVYDQKPTLHLFLPWHKKILNYCKETEMNSVEMKKLKKRAEISLKTMFPIDYRHQAATFLWPSMRKMKMLSNLEKKEFMREIQMEINEIHCEEEVEMKDPLAEEEPPAKQRKTHFDQWMEIPNKGDAVHDEIAKYLMLRPDVDESKILNWWKVNEKKLPRLATLAKKYLNIPASKKHCEMLFKPARVLLQDRKANVHPFNVACLNFLHESYNSS